MLPQNNSRLNINQASLSMNRVLRISKSTIVAYRLSVNVQNILTHSKKAQKYLNVINHHVAAYREMLIRLGQEEDCPELRENLRKLRSSIVQECKSTAQFLISPGNTVNIGENQHLIQLFHLLQLFLHELFKGYHLIQTIPMDMNNYFDRNLLQQSITSDFTVDELSSIVFDLQEIQLLLKKIQAFIPQD